MSQHFQVKLWHNGSDLVTRTIKGSGNTASIFAQYLMRKHFPADYPSCIWTELGSEQRFGTPDGDSWPKAVYVKPVTVPVDLSKSAPTSYVAG